MAGLLDYTPRRYIDFWKHDQQSVLCGTVNGTYMLDQISAFVWERCDGHHTVQEIIDELVDVTGMQGNAELVRADVLRLMENWRDERLIIHHFDPLHAFSECDEEKLYDLGSVDPGVEILLVVPPSPNPATGMNRRVQSTYPLGIATLSAVLKEHGYRVAMANLWLAQTNRRSLVRYLEQVRPRVLGISCMTDNFTNGVAIARVARDLDPNVRVVFGGPHVTFTDLDSLRAHSEIDVVVRNEGEFALLELMDLWCRGQGNLERIRGISYRSGAELVRNGARPLIRNLDELPLPDRGHLNLGEGMVGIQTSRGCPGRCIFCVASSMAGGTFRIRSAGSVMDEILHLYHQGARRFFFQDDTFTADLDRLHQILDLMRKFSLKIDWSAESRVDVIDKDPEIFAKMAATGCTWVQFGVEAGAQETLDSLQKNIEVDQIFRAIRAARAAGLHAVCTMLMGHPFDTEASIEHSVGFAERLMDLGAHALFSIVVPYPGTKLERQAPDFGLTIHPTAYNDYFVANTIMDTRFLKRSEIRRCYFDGMRRIMLRNSEIYRLTGT